MSRPVRCRLIGPGLWETTRVTDASGRPYRIRETHPARVGRRLRSQAVWLTGDDRMDLRWFPTLTHALDEMDPL